MITLNDVRIDASEVVELCGCGRRSCLRVRVPWTELALLQVWPSTISVHWEHLDDPLGALQASLVEWVATPSEMERGLADVRIVLEMVVRR